MTSEDDRRREIERLESKIERLEAKNEELKRLIYKLDVQVARVEARLGIPAT